MPDGFAWAVELHAPARDQRDNVQTRHVVVGHESGYSTFEEMLRDNQTTTEFTARRVRPEDMARAVFQQAARR